MDIEYYNNSHRIPHGKVVPLGAHHGIRVFHVIRAVVAPCGHGEQQSRVWFCSTHHIFYYFHRMFHWRPIHGKHYTAVPSSLCMTDELSHAQTTVHAITCHIGFRQSPLFLSTVSFLTKQMKNELLIVRTSRNCDPREAENISGTPPRVVTLIPTRFGSIFSLYGAKTNLKAGNSLFAT